MMVEFRNKYRISSNKESGLGRYDIMLEPKEKGEDAFIIEFKVVHTRRGETPEDALKSALEQIEKKKYASVLCERGVSPEKIWKYGFVFKGKEVLIGDNTSL